MSKYTTEVRYICEVSAGLTESAGFDDIENIITTAAPHIFNFTFPIFDDAYKLPLEKKILRHFYTREICEETVGLWKLRLCDKLNNIMPYYNKLYESELLEFNPLYDVDYRNERTGNRSTAKSDSAQSEQNVSGSNYTNASENVARTSTDSTLKQGSESNAESFAGNENGSYSDSKQTDRSGSATTSGTSANQTVGTDKKWDLYSDTPQGGIDGIEGNTGETIGENFFLTNARKNTDENSVNANSATNESSESADNEESSASGTSAKSKEESRQNAGSYQNESQNTSSGSTQTDSSRVAGRNDSTSKTENSQSVANSLEEYADHIFGKRGDRTFSKMLMEFRETFLNIDAMILEELEPLFMGVW